jgi:N-formylglutamate amidohydrolase
MGAAEVPLSAPDDESVQPYPAVQSAAFDVRAPAAQTAPVVFASPHSGCAYSPAFIAASRLDPLMLRRSEDAFVDEIFAAAPDHGAPLIRAHFPRAYVDPNRESHELDPAMFADALPDHVNSRSPRVAAGLGTVARIVASGEEIYSDLLRWSDAKRRIENCYVPYHAALGDLVDETRRRFGVCLLVDCHSMPSVGGPMDADPGHPRSDFILGDCHATSCVAAVSDLAERSLVGLGYQVTRNDPYAGGFTTRHYGRPGSGVHALQIEINRGLYMNEWTIERGPGMAPLIESTKRLIENLVAIDPALLTVP